MQKTNGKKKPNFPRIKHKENKGVCFSLFLLLNWIIHSIYRMQILLVIFVFKNSLHFFC